MEEMERQTPTPITWRLPSQPQNGVGSGVRVGVLALQGDYLEHLLVLRHLGAEVVEVRLPKDLAGIRGLVIPGGESTTMVRLMDQWELREPLKGAIQGGMPVWGTCAGMILLARRLREDRPEPLGCMDIVVARNAFGRQVDSFEADLEVDEIGAPPYRAIFIRAPVILKVGEGVKALARLADGTPVAARQGNMLVTSFHPELTSDTRFHSYFLGIVGG
jgi:5'-phosphate synthase pdxT subunit